MGPLPFVKGERPRVGPRLVHTEWSRLGGRDHTLGDRLHLQHARSFGRRARVHSSRWVRRSAPRLGALGQPKRVSLSWHRDRQSLSSDPGQKKILIDQKQKKVNWPVPWIHGSLDLREWGRGPRGQIRAGYGAIVEAVGYPGDREGRGTPPRAGSGGGRIESRILRAAEGPVGGTRRAAGARQARKPATTASGGGSTAWSDRRLREGRRGRRWGSSGRLVPDRSRLPLPRAWGAPLRVRHRGDLGRARVADKCGHGRGPLV